MHTNIPVCCCKAKRKFDLVLPIQKNSMKSISAGARTSAPCCSHQHLTSFLAGKFQTNPSQLSHLLKSRVNQSPPPEQCAQSRTGYCQIGNQDSAKPQEAVECSFCKIFLCPKICSKPCSFEAVPRERARH